MKAMIKCFMCEEDGAAGVEYALLLAFMTLVVVASGPAAETAVDSIWGAIAIQPSTAAA